MHVHGVIQEIRTTALSQGYDVKSRLILSPDPAELERNMEELQKNVNMQPTNIPVYDQFMNMLSLEVISNTRKHQDCWTHILANNSTRKNDSDLHMVIEDDTFLLPYSKDHLVQLLKMLRAPGCPEWDMIFLGLANNNHNTNTQSLLDVRAISPVLPAKESYLIRPGIIEQCKSLFQILRFPMRIQLSHWLHTTPSVKAMHPTKRVFLDGSKLGVMPSAVHPNNALVFNKEYMELFEIHRKPREDIEKNMHIVLKIYSMVSSMNSCDVCHLMGNIYAKVGKVDEAKQMYMTALKLLMSHGIGVRSHSETYQNLVQLHQNMQADIPSIVCRPSKYEDPMMATSDKMVA
jgi:hypothetical protein